MLASAYSPATPIASVALFASIPLVIALFSNLPREKAAAYTLVGSALFLPELVSIDVPYLQLDKSSVPALVAFILVSSSKPKIKVRSSPWIAFHHLAFMVGRVGTVLTNQYPLLVGPGIILAGLNKTNILTLCVNAYLWVLVPFALARRVLRTTEGVVEFLRVMSNLGFLYTFLMIVELVMSPQINVWVYGYHQHDFAQTVRSGGYRPMVFMAQGLVCTMFLVCAILSTVTLGKLGEKLPYVTPFRRATFMTLILSLCNSLGSLIYGLVITPVLLFSPPRVIARFASIGVPLILAVPTFRALEWVPLDSIAAFFGDIDQSRADSLQYRFDMEEGALKKWEQQPWFGFSPGRAATYNERGQRTSIYDGSWIIELVCYGYWGFLAFFSLLLAPVYVAGRETLRPLQQRERVVLAGMMMLTLISTFELLINSYANNLLIVFAGSLFGYCEELVQQRKLLRRARAG